MREERTRVRAGERCAAGGAMAAAPRLHKVYVLGRIVRCVLLFIYVMYVNMALYRFRPDSRL